MSADDDDHGGDGDGDGDDMLAMRAVWQSMRQADEEPPARGMAELMAAARAQVHAAEPVAAEPAWRRWMGVLVRPPVLAFATVVLVAGTAVVVKTHGGLDAQQAQQADEAPSPSPSSSSSPSPSPSASASPSPSPSPSASPSPSPSPGPSPSPSDAVAVSRADRRAQITVASPKPMAPAMRAPVPKKKGSYGLSDDGGDFGTAVAKAPAAPPAEVAERKFAKPPPPISNDQLLRECQAAAARGDCRAVASFAERMRAQDAAFYKDTFARDAAIAKCLTANAD